MSAQQPRRRRAALTAVASIALLGGLAATGPGASAEPPPPPGGRHDAAPTITPAPQDLGRTGRAVTLPRDAEVVVDDATDGPARDRLLQVLDEAGLDRVVVRDEPSSRARFSVRLGPADRDDVVDGLDGTAVPDRAEGYALRVGTERGRTVAALGGHDGAGQYYAVQTLRQLIQPRGRTGAITQTTVRDWPSMPLRGTIEGFYGEPWTDADRLDQMEFYGDVKANTYIYAPKDDPFHRERWREPYPADQLATLTELVRAATAHHVRFTFAVSPGNTICFSDDADRAALIEKLRQMYDVGVRAFSVPLDDIDYQSWSCDADRAAYGEPSAGAAGAAHRDLLDHVQREFVERTEGVYPLQMVPTEYYDTKETPYKAALRELDEDVVVMWTGEGVVPVEVTTEQAQDAATAFGGPPFLWDNYPVNDFGESSGRLLLGPYADREPGLSDHLAGIVANPMNQAAASKVAVLGTAAFTWNDRAFDAEESWHDALAYLAGGDRRATEALEVFADLNRLAPTFGEGAWQPQAPALDARLQAFWADWQRGGRSSQRALRDLRGYVDRLAAAPAVIRGGDVDPLFVAEAEPWLDAATLWGRAAQASVQALEADRRGDDARARALVARSATLQQQAAAVRVEPPRNRWGNAPVRYGDGVLDVFLDRVAAEVD